MSVVGFYDYFILSLSDWLRNLAIDKIIIHKRGSMLVITSLNMDGILISPNMEYSDFVSKHNHGFLTAIPSNRTIVVDGSQDLCLKVLRAATERQVDEITASVSAGDLTLKV